MLLTIGEAHINELRMMIILFAINVTLFFFITKILHSLKNLPFFSEFKIHDKEDVSVIIPAYNESINITHVMNSVLNQKGVNLELIVIDDQSKDNTFELAQAISNKYSSCVKILKGTPTPHHFTGKNWACWQGQQLASHKYVLFLDADVRLKDNAIYSAIKQLKDESLDLLTIGPTPVFSCFSEMLVQPLMVSMIISIFNPKKMNDTKNKKAFAAGPFMLFKKETYQAIGGHRAISSEIVEDVQLGLRIKKAGYQMKLYYGGPFVTVLMYRNIKELWEGWSKNIFLGLEKNIISAIAMSLLIFILFVSPIFISYFSLTSATISWLSFAMFRYLLKKKLCLPMSYWYLTPIGGTVLIALIAASIFKTLTGIGWTWKGKRIHSFSSGTQKSEQ